MEVSKKHIEIINKFVDFLIENDCEVMFVHEVNSDREWDIFRYFDSFDEDKRYSELVCCGFAWDDSYLGREFWSKINDKWCETYKTFEL